MKVDINVRDDADVMVQGPPDVDVLVQFPGHSDLVRLEFNKPTKVQLGNFSVDLTVRGIIKPDPVPPSCPPYHWSIKYTLTSPTGKVHEAFQQIRAMDADNAERIFRSQFTDDNPDSKFELTVLAVEVMK